MTELALSIAVFTGLVMLLVAAILLARAYLVPSGTVHLAINEREAVAVEVGQTLLATLREAGVNMPAACGGRGTCGLCRLLVLEGGGVVRPIETARFSRGELAAGARLACQVRVGADMHVRVPDEVLGARSLVATVRSTRSVATFMKEIVLALPAGEALEFRAGAFVQVTCPPYRLPYPEIDIPQDYRAEWDRLDLWRLVGFNDQPVLRAYSLANHPAERGPGGEAILMLVVRIATPPPASPPETPTGVVSSWLFGLTPGDEIEVTGPFGHFFIEEGEREIVLVGGGAGMAPLRSQVLDQLLVRKSGRKMSFWYGARSLKELFYAEEFAALAREHTQFRFEVALSDPQPTLAPDTAWTGATGFIHRHLHDAYLAQHPAPEDCEYYLCGPPLMIRAVRAMLAELGVAEEDVHFDDFGG